MRYKIGENICSKITIDGFDYYVEEGKIVHEEWCIEDGKLVQWFGNLTNNRLNTLKIYATNNYFINSPKIENETKFFSSNQTIDYSHGFKDGFNKHAEIHKFSHAEIDKIIELAYDLGIKESNFSEKVYPYKIKNQIFREIKLKNNGK